MKFILAFIISITAFQTAPAMAKGSKHCPPGLAKKTPACVPPGQAKKGATAEEWRDDGDHYERDDDADAAILRSGDVVRIDGEDYVVIDTQYGPVLRRGDDLFRLPRHDGSDYVRVGDALVRVDRKTKALLEWIRLTDLILS